ncbi:MAG: hypothetical protein ACI8W3_000959 [Myxococcota bacterium]|jgi:hypothetical protein
MRVTRLKRFDEVATTAAFAAVVLTASMVLTGCDSDPKMTSTSPPTHAEAAEGRWVAPNESEHADDDASLVEQLIAIGYVQGSRSAAKRGVTTHEPSQAYPGLNLYSSGHAPEAILMDMNGEVLHRWHLPFEAAFPPLDRPNTNSQWWRRVAIYPNGDLLAIFEGLGLVKIDKDSNLIWASSLNAHHDLEVQASGDIYVLTRKAHVVPRIDAGAPILEDFVSILSPEGKLKAEMSLLQAFENSRFADLVQKNMISGNGDIFHTNTIAVLGGATRKRNRAFAPGNLLVSMNRMGVVAVVSIEMGQVIWVRRTGVVGQHDPKLLPNGNMLLFTNNMDTGSSAVEEFDVTSSEVHWAYRGTEAQPFYSKYLGTAERLPNANTLITESDGGRAIEVTRAGETVWEFYNPNRAGDGGAFIATLPEVVRLPESFPIEWAARPTN